MKKEKKKLKQLQKLKEEERIKKMSLIENALNVKGADAF